MDFGEKGELIFEDELEARVAVELLNGAGRSDLVDHVRPPLNNPGIGYFEFSRRMRDLRHGQVEEGVHRVEEPDALIEIVKTLVKTSNMHYTFRTNRAGTRRDFMGAKLRELHKKNEDRQAESKIASTDRRMTKVELGDAMILGYMTAEEADSIAKRRAFVEQYLAERGWDATNLTIEQLIEVRSQPGWKLSDEASPS